MALVVAIVADDTTGEIVRQVYCDDTEVAAQAETGEVAISSPFVVHKNRVKVDLEADPLALTDIAQGSTLIDEIINLESDRTYTLACATGTTAQIGETTFTSVDDELTATFPAGDTHVVIWTDPDTPPRRLLVQTRSFTDLQAYLIANANDERAELLEEPITLSSSGYVIDGDADAQLSILAVVGHSVALLASGNLVPDVDWVLSDNTVVTLDDEDQLEMLAHVSARRQAVILSTRSKKDDIEAATTVAGALAAAAG